MDEYHELLDAAIYRKEAIQNLLHGLKGFENVTFLSATPIPYKYQPEELIGFPYYEINWTNSIRVKPYRVQTDSPFSLAAAIIQKHKAGNSLIIEEKAVQEYFFFVNTVNGAKQIIKAAKLAPEEVKIVCAKGGINNLKLGERYKIQDISEQNKTFNFLTKTAFYGADIYSEAGLAIIVSDGWVRSTLLDITSDIHQIAGRIRNDNNPFKHIILHIHSPKANLLSREEFESELSQRIREAEQDINSFNLLLSEGTGLESSIVKKQKNNEPEALSYYDPDNHSIKIDNLKIAYMQHKFETVDSIYSNGISIEEAYKQAGYNVEEAETWIQNVRKMVVRQRGQKPFHEYFQIYSEERNKMSISQTDLAKEISQKYPLISKAYSSLGVDKVSKLKFNEDKVRKLVHLESQTTQSALKKELGDNFSFGERFTNGEVKEVLSKIFKRLRIEFTPKTTFLNRYLGVKKVKIDIPESHHRKDGIEITRDID